MLSVESGPSQGLGEVSYKIEILINKYYKSYKETKDGLDERLNKIYEEFREISV